jgi:hypothetical protein
MSQQSSTAVKQRGPSSGVHRAINTPKPLLASEVLRDELAPLAPGRGASRVWLVGVCLALVLLGVALKLGVGMETGRRDAATMSFSAAGATAAVALLPFPYALRAGVALLLGAVLAALGLRGTGPLAGLVLDGMRHDDLARLLTLTTLPAALLFRAHYRAYRPARWVLAAALVLACPFVALELKNALNADLALLSRLASATSVAAVLSALFGFMGSGTTGAGSVWAALVLAVLPLEVALRDLTSRLAETELLAYPAAAIGLACAAILATVGVFQLLAAGLARHARHLTLRADGTPSQQNGST